MSGKGGGWYFEYVCVRVLRVRIVKCKSASGWSQLTCFRELSTPCFDLVSRVRLWLSAPEIRTYLLLLVLIIIIPAK